MTKDNLKRQKQKVEELGIFFEKTGQPPMSGRVMAYLLLAEPPQQDFFAIQEYLQASKSAVSTTLKRLQQEGQVDYITFSGDRKRYFKINPKMWIETSKKQIAAVRPFVEFLETVMAERKDSTAVEFNEELEELCAFYNYLADELPKVMDKWDEMKKKR